MRLIIKLCLFIVPFFSGTFSVYAQEPHIQSPSAQELYYSGVKAFENSNFQEASQNFRLAYTKSPRNLQILFNWGLSEYKLGRIGMAAGAWRRALALDPDFGLADQALRVLSPELPSTQTYGEAQFFENFRKTILSRVTLTQIGVATALFLFGSGWILLSYLGGRKRAKEEEKSLPAFPGIGVGLLILFLVTSGIGLSKIYDFFQPRATVIANLASVYSSPSENSSSLFEIAEGLEVVMNRQQKGWRQISSPGGLSGWVKEESLFQTSGRQ